MEQAIQFLRSIQDRARGGLARSERFDAAQVVRSCVALERPLAGRRSVALRGEVSASGVFLQGDPNALYQVLTNLIRNAVAASRAQNSPVVVTLVQVGEALRLAVEDHGVGIAAEHLERIFEPGFTTSEFGSGSGTGLTVVRQITKTCSAERSGWIPPWVAALPSRSPSRSRRSGPRASGVRPKTPPRNEIRCGAVA